MTMYVALIHKEEGSDYGVSFPDLPGCVSAGKSVEEAIRLAREALALHIEGMIEEHEILPAPSTPEEIIKRGEATDAILAMIELPEDAKVERINVTVPKLTLARFDSFAARNHMNRSNLFVAAVEQMIEGHGSREEIAQLKQSFGE